MSRAIINLEIQEAFEAAKRTADPNYFPNYETEDAKWAFVKGYIAACHKMGKKIDTYMTIEDLL
jgi:hypothetical protein